MKHSHYRMDSGFCRDDDFVHTSACVAFTLPFAIGCCFHVTGVRLVHKSAYPHEGEDNSVAQVTLTVLAYW